MLQFPVVVGQMMDYHYRSTDKNIFFIYFNQYFPVMFISKH